MKKIIVLLVTSFLFINNYSALTLEDKLDELIKDVDNLEKNRLDKTYPVGSIFETTTYSTVGQVNDALGGVWEVYGLGKTLIGVDPNDDNFNTVNKTGGSTSTILSTSNLPSHTHLIPALSGIAEEAGTHTHNNTAQSSTITGSFGAIVPNYHGVRYATGAFKGTTMATNSSDARLTSPTTSVVYGYKFEATPTITMTNASAGAHTHTITTTASTTDSVGSGTAFTNLQPYITVYRYQRVA